MIDPLIMETAQYMYWELESNRLEVVLVPALGYNDPRRKIRRAVSHNPIWYQEFCSDYPSGRSNPRQRKKPDTLIKRKHTIRALKEIARGRCESLYAERLIPYVKDYYAELCKRYKQPNRLSSNGRKEETHEPKQFVV